MSEQPTPQEPGRAPGSVPMLTLAGIFFRIGIFSFGGGLTGWVHREIVQKHHWMSDEEMLSGVALAQVLPGANVTNLVVYVGNHLRGRTGAAVCLAALIGGPMVLCILVLASWETIRAVPLLHAAVDGVAAAAVGINLRLGIAGASRIVPRIAPTLAMIATFVAIGILRWPLVTSVLAIAPVSIALSWPRKSVAGKSVSREAGHD